MRKIKIDFLGFWSGFDKKDNPIYSILSEKYQVEISDSPDYLFVSPLCKPFEYMKYDCVRILYTGEPISPDFNVFDYAIGFDEITCLDKNRLNRYYRYPLVFWCLDELQEHIRGLSRDEAQRALEQKKYFCNFIYGHQSKLGERERLLSTIQKYKRVESAGSFLNNMPDGLVVPFNEKKKEFLRQCKFTIACESLTRPGFVTEKLIHPICNYSIPIYFGNPFVEDEFNGDAIVNCHNYSSFEEALERVIEIDNDDELYIKMLMQPKLVSDTYLADLYQGLKEFLWRIVSEEREDAYRRMPYYLCECHEMYLNNYRKLHGDFLSKVVCRLKK